MQRVVGLVIFAGGRASRLGGANKALLPVGGAPVLRRILERVGPLADEWLALTQADGRAALAALEPRLRLVVDPEPHAGVLAALAQGLAAAASATCLAVACDMPFVSRALFEHQLRLLEDADVVIPRDAEGLQPMHAAYRREPVLQAVRAALARGDRRMVSYFGDVRVREVPEPELRPFEPERVFLNVNTPEDLARAQALAAAD